MSHNKIKGLLSAYLDGELDAKFRDKGKEHLDICSACRKEYRALEQLDEFSREVMPAQQKKEYWESLPSRIKSGIELPEMLPFFSSTCCHVVMLSCYHVYAIISVLNNN